MIIMLISFLTTSGWRAAPGQEREGARHAGAQGDVWPPGGRRGRRGRWEHHWPVHAPRDAGRRGGEVERPHWAAGTTGVPGGEQLLTLRVKMEICWGSLFLFQLLGFFFIYFGQRLRIIINWERIYSILPSEHIHCVPYSHLGAISLYLVTRACESQVIRYRFQVDYPTYVPTRLCSSTAGSSPPRRTAIFVYAVHHVSMLHPSTVPGRLAKLTIRFANFFF